jgi:hypothetical protein
VQDLWIQQQALPLPVYDRSLSDLEPSGGVMTWPFSASGTDALSCLFMHDNIPIEPEEPSNE